MSFVVDSSISMTWCFETEATAITEALLRRLYSDSAYAPSLWTLEVVNVLTMALRFQRISSDGYRERLHHLRSLPIILDTETSEQAWTATNELAQHHSLTIYDAAYLELAKRLSLPLATLDRDLRKAATRCGVPLLGK